MDVHCSTCGEPWDVYHLWHDAIFDTGLAQCEAEAWIRLPLNQKLSEPFREQFHRARWEFGRTLTNVVRCPCCPKGAQPHFGRVHTKAALEELFGDDQDGLAATYEDYRL